MKFFGCTFFFIAMLALTGCGAKGSRGSNMSGQYALSAFEDYEYPSTLNLDLLKDLPRNLDLKSSMTSAKDQDARGACSYFAAIGLVESAIKRKMNIDVNLSEEYLNYASKSAGFDSHDEGGWPITNLSVAITQNTGFLLERDWPYQPTWFGARSSCKNFSATDPKAPLECFTHNKPPESILSKKIEGTNFKLTSLEAETTNEIIEFLANEKKPVSIVIPVNDNGWDNNGTVEYTDEERADCITNKVACGTHVILLTGYDLDKKVFLFKNSWSKLWGVNGFGTIPFSMIDLHVKKEIATVDLVNDIDLPADHAKSYVSVDNVQNVLEENSDGSLSVKTSGLKDEMGVNALISESAVVTKSTWMTGEINDTTAEEIELSAQDKSNLNILYLGSSNAYNSIENFIPKEWTEDAPEILKLGAELFSSETVQELKSKNTELFLRSTILIYTDDEKYKILSRNYQTIP